ncbi:MAG: hypothetical protein WBG43_03035 [Marinifilaceae bacterium]
MGNGKKAILACMENSKEMFSIALGLVSPWTVESISFEETEAGKALHIYLSFTKGSKFKGDDKIDYTAYDTIKRTWQYLNFFQHDILYMWLVKI